MFYLQQPKQELDPEPPKWSDPKLGPQKGGRLRNTATMGKIV